MINNIDMLRYVLKWDDFLNKIVGTGQIFRINNVNKNLVQSFFRKMILILSLV